MSFWNLFGPGTPQGASSPEPPRPANQGYKSAPGTAAALPAKATSSSSSNSAAKAHTISLAMFQPNLDSLLAEASKFHTMAPLREMLSALPRNPVALTAEKVFTALILSCDSMNTRRAVSNSARQLLFAALADLTRIVSLQLLPILTAQHVHELCHLIKRLAMPYVQERLTASLHQHQQQQQQSEKDWVPLTPSEPPSLETAHAAGGGAAPPVRRPLLKLTLQESSLLSVKDEELLMRLLQLAISLSIACPLGSPGLGEIIGVLMLVYTGAEPGSVTEATCEATLSEMNTNFFTLLENAHDDSEDNNNNNNSGNKAGGKGVSFLRQQMQAVAYFKDVCRLIVGLQPKWISLQVSAIEEDGENDEGDGDTMGGGEEDSAAAKEESAVSPSFYYTERLLKGGNSGAALQALVGKASAAAVVDDNVNGGADAAPILVVATIPYRLRWYLLRSLVQFIGRTTAVCREAQSVSPLFSQCLQEDVMLLAIHACASCSRGVGHGSSSGGGGGGGARSNSPSSASAAHTIAESHEESKVRTLSSSMNQRTPHHTHDPARTRSLSSGSGSGHHNHSHHGHHSHSTSASSLILLASPAIAQHGRSGAVIDRFLVSGLGNVEREELFLQTQKLAVKALTLYACVLQNHSSARLLMIQHTSLVRECRLLGSFAAPVKTLLYLWKKALSFDFHCLQSLLIGPLLRRQLFGSAEKQPQEEEQENGPDDEMPPFVTFITESTQLLIGILSSPREADGAESRSPVGRNEAQGGGGTDAGEGNAGAPLHGSFSFPSEASLVAAGPPPPQLPQESKTPAPAPASKVKHPAHVLLRELLAFDSMFARGFSSLVDETVQRDEHAHPRGRDGSSGRLRAEASNSSMPSDISTVSEIKTEREAALRIFRELHPLLLYYTSLGISSSVEDEFVATSGSTSAASAAEDEAALGREREAAVDGDMVVQHLFLKGATYWIRVCCSLCLPSERNAYVSAFVQGLRRQDPLVQELLHSVSLRHSGNHSAAAMHLSAAASIFYTYSAASGHPLLSAAQGTSAEPRASRASTVRKYIGKNMKRWAVGFQEMRKTPSEGLTAVSPQGSSASATPAAAAAAADPADLSFSTLPESANSNTTSSPSKKEAPVRFSFEDDGPALLFFAIQRLHRKLRIMEYMYTVASSVGEALGGSWNVIAQGIALTEPLIARLQLFTVFLQEKDPYLQEVLADAYHMRDAFRQLFTQNAAQLSGEAYAVFLTAMVTQSCRYSTVILNQFIELQQQRQRLGGKDKGKPQQQKQQQHQVAEAPFPLADDGDGVPALGEPLVPGNNASTNMEDSTVMLDSYGYGFAEQWALLAEALLLTFVSLSCTTPTATSGTSSKESGASHLALTWAAIERFYQFVSFPPRLQAFARYLYFFPRQAADASFAQPVAAGVRPLELVSGARGSLPSPSASALRTSLVAAATAGSATGTGGGAGAVGGATENAFLPEEMQGLAHVLTQLTEGLAVVVSFYCLLLQQQKGQGGAVAGGPRQAVLRWAEEAQASALRDASLVELIVSYNDSNSLGFARSSLATATAANAGSNTPAATAMAPLVNNSISGAGEKRSLFSLADNTDDELRSFYSEVRTPAAEDPLRLLHRIYASLQPLAGSASDPSDRGASPQRLQQQQQQSSSLPSPSPQRRQETEESSSPQAKEARETLKAFIKCVQEEERRGVVDGARPEDVETARALRVATDELLHSAAFSSLQSVLKMVSSFADTMGARSWVALLKFLQFTTAVNKRNTVAAPVSKGTSSNSGSGSRRMFYAVETAQAVFRTVEVIQQNSIALMDSEGVFELIICAGGFLGVVGSEDQQRLHINLSAAQLLWSIADFLASSSNTMRGHDDGLWCALLLELHRGCMDLRPEVRHSALRTLLALVQAYGSQLSGGCWRCILADIVSPITALLQAAVVLCAIPPPSLAEEKPAPPEPTSTAPTAGRPSVKAAQLSVSPVRESRRQASPEPSLSRAGAAAGDRAALLELFTGAPKQADEMRVAFMEGCGRVLLSHYLSVRVRVKTATSGGGALAVLLHQTVLEFVCFCADSCRVLRDTTGEGAALAAANALHGLLVECSGAYTPAGGGPQRYCALPRRVSRTAWAALERLVLRHDGCRHTEAKQCTPAVVSTIVAAVCDDLVNRRRRPSGTTAGRHHSDEVDDDDEDEDEEDEDEEELQQWSSDEDSGRRSGSDYFGISNFWSGFGGGKNKSGGEASSASPTAAAAAAAAAPYVPTQSPLEDFHTPIYFSRFAGVLAAASTGTAAAQSFFFPGRVQTALVDGLRAVWPLLSSPHEADALCARVLLPAFPTAAEAVFFVTQDRQPGLVVGADPAEVEAARQRLEGRKKAGERYVSLRSVLPPAAHPSALLLYAQFMLEAVAVTDGTAVPRRRGTEYALVLLHRVAQLTLLRLASPEVLGTPPQQGIAYHLPPDFHENIANCFFACADRALSATSSGCRNSDGGADEEDDGEAEGLSAEEAARLRGRAVSTLCTTFRQLLQLAGGGPAEAEEAPLRSVPPYRVECAVFLERFADYLGEAVAGLVEVAHDDTNAAVVASALLEGSSMKAPHLSVLAQCCLCILRRWGSSAFVQEERQRIAGAVGGFASSPPSPSAQQTRSAAVRPPGVAVAPGRAPVEAPPGEGAVAMQRLHDVVRASLCARSIEMIGRYKADPASETNAQMLQETLDSVIQLCGECQAVQLARRSEQQRTKNAQGSFFRPNSSGSGATGGGGGSSSAEEALRGDLGTLRVLFPELITLVGCTCRGAAREGPAGEAPAASGVLAASEGQIRVQLSDALMAVYNVLKESASL